MGQLCEWCTTASTFIWESARILGTRRHRGQCHEEMSRHLGTRDSIAIVGMACRFPGADSPAAFWDILKQGRDVVSEIGADRWGTDYYFHRNRTVPGKSYTFSAGILNDVEHFDADFFGISPREASQMDPQQRLLLE